jgi:hypothetical protein
VSEPQAHGVAHRHTSDTNEHYTPPRIVVPATRVLGAIDLDPASCELANEYIGANRIHTAEDDGLKHPWYGRVFLNPPGGLVDQGGRRVFVKTKTRESCSVTGACGLAPGPKHVHHGVESSALVWWKKLVSEFEVGRVKQALFVAFSFDLVQTSVGEALRGGAFSAVDYPCVWLGTRVKYLTEPTPGVLKEGGAPPGGSFLVYLGPVHQREALWREFREQGRVTVPMTTPVFAA